MISKLIIGADMTAGTGFGPHFSAFKGNETSQQVIGSADLWRLIMRRQPAFCTTMTALAADSVRRLKTRTAFGHWNDLGMTGQTGGRFVRGA
jgi:hypothetical protein